MVVGGSLGAVVALAAARAGSLTAPLILVAPALGFGPRWIEKLAPGGLPYKHHQTGEVGIIDPDLTNECAENDN